MQKGSWKLEDLESNHEELVEKLKKHYKIK